MSREPADAPGHPLETVHPGLAEVVGFCEGDLSSEAARHFEVHLARCPECRSRVHSAERVLAEVDQVVERPSPEWSSDADRLLDQLRAKHAAAVRRGSAGTVPRQPSQRFWLPLAGFSAVVALIAVVQLLLALKLPAAGRKLGGQFEGHGPPAVEQKVAP